MNLDIMYLIVSLFLGMFAVYILTPEPYVVMKYPDYDTNTLYIDENKVCYKYYPKRVKCSNL